MIVMNIWNIVASQKQKSLTWAELGYVMLVSNMLSYLLVNIMLSSQNRVTTIFTSKFEINNFAFTIKDRCEGHFNWHMNEISPSDYAVDICIFHWVCIKQKYFRLNDPIVHNKAKFQHLTTFGWRDIPFPMWCLLCNSHWTKWPKTVFGWCTSQWYQHKL